MVFSVNKSASLLNCTCVWRKLKQYQMGKNQCWSTCELQLVCDSCNGQVRQMHETLSLLCQYGKKKMSVTNEIFYFVTNFNCYCYEYLPYLPFLNTQFALMPNSSRMMYIAMKIEHEKWREKNVHQPHGTRITSILKFLIITLSSQS